MKLVRYLIDNRIECGVLEGQTLSAISGSLFDPVNKTGTAVSLCDAKILAPVIPGKIICIGLNYKDHIKETHSAVPDSPVVFLKPSTATISTGDAIEYPEQSNRVDYEGELAIVIGKRACKVKRENYKDYLLGYTCANDVTARDLQPANGQWTIAKGFDTFFPIGPCIETEFDDQAAAIKTSLNGKIVQNSNIRELLFDPGFLVEFISHVMTLEPGDIISTGTPSGIGGMDIGDTVSVDIEGIGTLINVVKA